jgi:predicted metal-dependent phosphoesterase TrpH
LIYDLHTHSNASDGVLTPAALVTRAKQRGVTHLALTDHDTVQGLHSAQQQADIEGIQLIHGIELSCLWAGRSIHIVGLNIDVNSAPLQQAIFAQQEARDSRAIEIAKRLEKAGIPDPLQGARRIAGDAVLGRPHFARYLVEHGFASSINGAFKQYLGAGKPGDIKHQWPDIGSMTAAIRAAGGTPVLAHPAKYELTRTKLRELTATFKEAGGLAIEVVSGQQERNETDALAQIAAQFDLHASCGSDFHMPDQPWQELGSFTPLPSACKPVWQLWH